LTVLRKPFDRGAVFPFVFVHRDTKQPHQELPDHVHDWEEIVYVHRGRGTFLIDHRLYPMREGDLFVIPGNTVHRANPDPDDPVTSSVVFFDRSLIGDRSLGESFSLFAAFDRAKSERNHRISLRPETRRTVERWLDAVHDEISLLRPGYRHAVAIALARLLLELGRETAARVPEDGRASEPPAAPPWIRDALDLLERRPGAAVTLASLARNANVTPAHFSRVFRKATGMTVTSYRIMKQIVLAKEALMNTDDKIAAVAERCGFESLPHFYRMFKRHVGVSPAAFRKRHRPRRP